MKFYASRQFAQRSKPMAKWLFSAPSKVGRITADLEFVAAGELLWFTSCKVIKQAEKHLEAMGHSPTTYEILYGNYIELKDPV
jgi:hypothetical protein